VAKTGNQAYQAVNKALTPELVTQVGPTYETIEEAITATKDPVAKEILASMGQTQAENLAADGVLEMTEGVISDATAAIAPEVVGAASTGAVTAAGTTAAPSIISSVVPMISNVVTAAAPYMQAYGAKKIVNGVAVFF